MSSSSLTFQKFKQAQETGEYAVEIIDHWLKVATLDQTARFIKVNAISIVIERLERIYTQRGFDVEIVDELNLIIHLKTAIERQNEAEGI